MGFQMQICSMFTFLLVDFGKVLCSAANELQKTQILTQRFIAFHFTFAAFCLLSVIRKQ